MRMPARFAQKIEEYHENRTVMLPYQERVMLGSDRCGKFELEGRTMARYNGLLAALPEDARKKGARLNAEKLWFDQKPGREFEE